MGLPGGVHITLTWTAVPGAASYRIYRSPMPNLIAGSERLLATVSAPTTRFTDDGTRMTGTDAPREIGDLGVWLTLPPLVAPREGAAVVAGTDPATPGRWYLYAIAGRSAPGAALNNYERLTVDIGPDGSQSFAPSWLPDATNLLVGGARWQVGGFRADQRVTTRVGTDTWIYVGGGRSATGTLVSATDAARVSSGGTLTWMATDALTPAGAGYGAVAAANQLFVFGGQNGNPDTGIRSAQICGVGLTCMGGPPDPPDLQNWNAAGVSMLVPRVRFAIALESGHIYVLGGETTGGAATDTTESFVW
jgi:hypothetical protein